MDRRIFPDTAPRVLPLVDPGLPHIAVVGAGLSGLRAAYELIKAGARVTLYEAASSPGGNAWLETHGHLEFPTAGSCFRFPAPGSDTDTLLREIGLRDSCHSTTRSMQVLFRTSALVRSLPTITLACLKHPRSLLDPKLWGLTAKLCLASLTNQPLVKADKSLGDPIFHDLYTFLDRLAPDGGSYPALPWTESCGISREDMERLDRLSIEQFLFDPAARQTLPRHLQPPAKIGALARTVITTTLAVEGLLLSNCSAYVGLHFLVGYLRGDLFSCRGGNGAVARRLLEHLSQTPRFTLHLEAAVSEVSQNERRYSLCVNEGGQDRIFAFDGVVVATPKDVAMQIVQGLPVGQLSAMREIEYSDYAIVNAELSQPIWTETFGGYFIGDTAPRAQPGSYCQAGGIVNASWSALGAQTERGGLTFLKPVPQRADQGRLANDPPAQLRQAAEAEVRRALRAIGVEETLLEMVWLHRWPRGLVSPRPGQVARDLFKQASQPLGAITFANQDSVGVGALESAMEAGRQAAQYLITHLAIPPQRAERAGSTRVYKETPQDVYTPA
ncbi:FAD-dependent oxidoreductase (plasmid) [Thioclava litoralis]|uniref:FAD-dependent oxidoreductase n=1 Tax=Thioclava litoralis TaxID=3076557 RepID=A0ABZ1E5G6_9RHOB|nr:FAD-dependent oxidoreductase [Thioclava sp. FTW29]